MPPFSRSYIYSGNKRQYRRLVVWFTRELFDSIDPSGTIAAFFEGVDPQVGVCYHFKQSEQERLFNLAYHLASELEYAKALEDSTLRTQNRLFKITEDAPANVHFCTESRVVGAGLEEQLETLLTAHPDTSLVIIDTLQMVRSAKCDNTYANDYSNLSALKKWRTPTASPSC